MDRSNAEMSEQEPDKKGKRSKSWPRRIWQAKCNPLNWEVRDEGTDLGDHPSHGPSGIAERDQVGMQPLRKGNEEQWQRVGGPGWGKETPEEQRNQGPKRTNESLRELRWMNQEPGREDQELERINGNPGEPQRGSQEPEQRNQELERGNQEPGRENQELKQRNQELERGDQELRRKNQELEQRNQDLERENQELKQRSQEPKRRNQELERNNEGPKQEPQRGLGEIQEREIISAKGRESHEAISGQFNDVFRHCWEWASAYFEIEITEFEIEKFWELGREFDLISFIVFESIKRKECFSVSHLVQGVLGNILAVEIFQSPFQGCAKEFRSEYSRHYKFMLGTESREAAHRWRAATLTAYYRRKSWALSGKEPRSMESYSEENIKEIFHRINNVLTPVTKHYFPRQTREMVNARNEGLVKIIREAKMLGEKMSQQGSELVVMDKKWFEKNGREVDLTGGKVQTRLAEEDDAEPGVSWEVDAILAPGFLKYGNDDSENLDQPPAVWARATVDARDLLATGADKE